MGARAGIGFAIPIDGARKVMETLISKDSVSRGYLGVLLENIGEGLAKALGLGGPEGVIVADVTKDSPAEAAGLKRRDVILKVDGNPVSDTVVLRNTIADAAPGTAVKLSVSRDGTPLENVAKLRGTAAADGRVCCARRGESSCRSCVPSEAGTRSRCSCAGSRARSTPCSRCR